MLARVLSGLLVAAAVVCAPGTAFAQAYPSRPITYVVPYPPGGVTDTSARVIGQKLSEALGQPVVIENKAGAGGMIGTGQVARARPDGYTIGHVTLGVMATSPHLGQAPYDVFRDFAPVANMVTSYTALIANKSFAPDTVQELVAYAKANPGKVFYASSGVGGISHIVGELLKFATDTDIVHVPYSGSAPAMTDLIAGRVQLLFDSTPVDRVASGQVKGLAAIGRTRIKGLPDLPTIYEAGVPNFKGGDAWLGVVAPAGTPPAIVQLLSDTLLKIAATPDFAARMESYGLAVTAQDHAAFARQIRDDYELYGDIIKRANIRVDSP
jgi:tripartite-type tricarboxylate transporter receptor subunit TctC